MEKNPRDTHFSSGADCEGDHGGSGGSVVFRAGNTGEEILRFEPDGRFIYRGTLVETDRELYEAFVSWLKKATRTLGKGEGDGGDATFTPH